MPDLGRLLSPASIAVVGGDAAAAVVRQCDRLGFQGPIWPVNPNRSHIEGRPCVDSVADLPVAPDAAFVAVPARAAIDVVAALRDMGTGGAVCYPSGFSEVGGAGVALQQRLVEAAGPMPLLGPNSYGLINALDGIALWPDEHGCRPTEHGVAIISQSGNIALNLTLARRGMPLTHMIDVGNQAALAVEDCIEALLGDERVAAIGMHLEAIADGVRFGEVALQALDRGVPLVALKTGASSAGAEINRSHTAAIAGTDGAYRALFGRYGVGRVHTLPELLESLNVLATIGPLDDCRLVSLSSSGGEASLVADRANHYAVVLPDLDAEHRDRVRGTLPDTVAVSNPLDYHTYTWGDRDALAATFTAMLEGPIDAGLLLLDVPAGDGNDATSWWAAIEAIARAHDKSGTVAIVVATLPENTTDEVRSYLRRHGIPVVHGIDETLRAVELAAALGRRRRDRRELHRPATGLERGADYDEAQSKRMLTDAGIPTPAGRVCARSEAPHIAAELGFPVAVKVPDIDHKSDHGAVLLGLADPQAVAAAVAELPGEGDVLVEVMIDHVVGELLVGFTIEPGLGRLLTLATGGTLVELLDDATHLFLPAAEDDIAGALARLRGHPLLTGYRDRPAGDLDAAIAAIAAAARLVVEVKAVELEINPLLVLAEGKGVVAADARIVPGQ